MTRPPSLPRLFGNYLLTAALGEDALGQVFRAVRLAGEGTFVRLRILESPELSEEAILDAIQANGEIHELLKHPTVARDVEMDAVDGTPYIAWREEGGRTLDALMEKGRNLLEGIPLEHALLIAGKVSEALEHAYNTTLEGERTLHGLLWPGFVLLSDDGEIRLTGFGLASGFFPSFEKPQFLREISPYLAPEERERKYLAANSDVYSVGVLLFQLLTGGFPTGDAAAEVQLEAKTREDPVPPEVVAVLRYALGPAEKRYPSAGRLRRDLAKLLSADFPSTFNFAYFLSKLFTSEIEAEGRARAREASLEPEDASEKPPSFPEPSETPEPPPSQNLTPLPWKPPPPAKPRPRRAARAGRIAWVVAVLLGAATLGTISFVARKAQPESPSPEPVFTFRREPAVEVIPEPVPTPSPAQERISESKFREEVARRVAQELAKIEEALKAQEAKPPQPAAEASDARKTPGLPEIPLAPTAVPTPESDAGQSAPPTPTERP